MKLALMFLPIFVAVSHQQYQPFMMGFPWRPSYIQKQPFINEYFMPNRYQRFGDDSAVGRYNPAPAIIIMANDEDADFEVSPLQMGPQYPNHLNNDNGFNDIQGRIKGFGSRRPLFGKQQNGRFFFNNNFAGGSSTIGNPLIKTATLTITSTCTALTVQSCIPAANVLAPPVACARKRQIRQGMLDEESHQYPITPTEVRIVMPTTEPKTAERVPRQHRLGISSSMNEDIDNEPTGLMRGTENQMRKARFFNFYQNFVTGLITTSWFVTSITSTKTYIPTDTVPAVVTLSCIPPGYVTC